MPSSTSMTLAVEKKLADIRALLSPVFETNFKDAFKRLEFSIGVLRLSEVAAQFYLSYMVRE